MTADPANPAAPPSGGAIVLFSGGQDSTTCLAWALERFSAVDTVSFDYGQRHRVELDCQARVRDRLAVRFPDWAGRLGRHHAIDLGVIASITASALTHDQPITVPANGLPSTFVPGRNIVFLTLAAVIAHGRGIGALVGGMCETDFSGYPDCRDDSIKALQVALNLGLATRAVIHTPLMWLDKAATWALAESLGGQALVNLIIEETHTCYRGKRSVRHAWGYGCGNCPACSLRADGYRRYQACRGQERPVK
ncbi:MAG TPA: 7-cyano-7-deazaguanine synthase QueC [Candidatus Defluviicoccus seviourii]|nr:7-cyano-7-deazaguanine synthase QueC [Candidatus Defluviicoccus seviourii]